MENIFFAGFSLYELVLFFFIYAFCGWCLEVIYAMIETGKLINKGFFSGPWCPIYGVGCILVIICSKPFTDNLLLIFIGSILLTSLLEFITGLILEKIFYGKWWDYSGIPFNIRGYICLPFSLMWGVACVFVVKVAHPLISKTVTALPRDIGYGIIGIISIAFIIDCMVTINSILKLKQKIREVIVLSEKLKGRMKETSNRIGETISEEIAELKEKWATFMESNHFTRARILKAFPDLQNMIKKIKKEVMSRINKGEQ